MPNTLRIMLVLPLILLTQGCATYNGAGPNLSLKGDAAKQEYEKFKMSQTFSTGRGVQLGRDGPAYSRDSLRPIMADISPDAIASLDRAHKWWNAEGITLGLALGSLVGYLVSPANSSARTAFFISTITLDGVSIGCAIGRDSNWSDSIDEFNRDLKSKLGISKTAVAPGINFALHF